MLLSNNYIILIMLNKDYLNLTLCLSQFVEPSKMNTRAFLPPNYN